MPLAKKVWPALARFDPMVPGTPFIRWVPLIMAPEWSEAQAEEEELKPGTELVQKFFEYFVGTKVPGYVPFGGE